MPEALVLRTCSADGTSYGGFLWPAAGPVEAPDWDPSPVCGFGLHGLLWGEGSVSYLDMAPDAIWQVVRIEESDAVGIDGDKIKFPRGEVVYSGTRDEAVKTLQSHPGSIGKAIAYGTATAGDRGTATAGDGGTATAGNEGTATAGDGGTATAGYRGTATAGYRGTATAGYRGTATAGYRGTATAGYRGTATAGDGGTATAGDGGTATAGDGGTATAGNGGTATAGDRGTATAGDGGVIAILRWNGKRYKLTVAEVGDDGLRPGVAYRLDDAGAFVVVIGEEVNA